MGIKLFSDTQSPSGLVRPFSRTGSYSPSTFTAPNPNKFRFRIKRVEKIGRYLAVMANYPDCTTHSGDKIMVYEYLSERALKMMDELDPHFLDTKNSPIARFPGNEEGWNLAIKFCQMAL